MSEALRRYLELERQLFELRKVHPEDVPEEDVLMDKMDDMWWQLTDEEMQWINQRDSSEHGKGPLA